MRVLVRAIRTLDRRGGLFSRHGQRAYARGARLLRGLHRHAAADAARTIGTAPATVVDVGSGPGDLLAELLRLAPAARVVGVEPSADMRAIAAQRGITSVDGRAEALPFDDRSVDLVVSSLSAHHWDDPAAAFAEIRRVLRPGGEARIYDIRFAGYGAAEAVSLAAAAGFSDGDLRHTVLDERVLGVRPSALISLRVPADGLERETGIEPATFSLEG